MKTCLIKIFSFFIFILICLASCEEETAFDDKNYKITSVTAVNNVTENGDPYKTTSLIITFDKVIPNLCADDILINSSFVLIKKELIEIDSGKYKLDIVPGGQGQIRMGLDPYRGFTGWEAKIINVYTDFGFEIINKKSVSITGYYLSESDVEIPVAIEEKPVTSIGNYAFINKNLTNVIIPDTVTEIGDYAFLNSNLISIIIPANVNKIGRYAFTNNNLTEITIPDSVKQIGASAFRDNEITNAVISNGLTIIETELFAYNKLVDVIIPNSVTLIKTEAFLNNEIETLDLGLGIKKVEAFAFWGNNFKRITIVSDVTLEKDSFAEDFEYAYNIINNKKGGTYVWP